MSDDEFPTASQMRNKLDTVKHIEQLRRLNVIRQTIIQATHEGHTRVSVKPLAVGEIAYLVDHGYVIDTTIDEDRDWINW